MYKEKIESVALTDLENMLKRKDSSKKENKEFVIEEKDEQQTFNLKSMLGIAEIQNTNNKINKEVTNTNSNNNTEANNSNNNIFDNL